MPQLVLKGDQVIAVHGAEQTVDLANDYPSADRLVYVSQVVKVAEDGTMPKLSDLGLSEVAVEAQTAKLELARSDKKIVRVIEDIVDLLLQKHVIDADDLPVDVQKKLTARKALREKV